MGVFNIQHYPIIPFNLGYEAAHNCFPQLDYDGRPCGKVKT